MEDLTYEHRRLNRMTQLVFTSANLAELRSAVHELFDLFSDVLGPSSMSYSELRTRLEHVSEDHLSHIRVKYLKHDEAGYYKGDFTDGENNSVVKILLDFVSMMDSCTATMLNKIGDKQQEVLILENKMKFMEERIRKTDAVNQSQKDFYTEKVSENAEMLKRNTELTQQIAEKSRKINELEKVNNVMLWEQEKKRYLAQSTSKIQELEAEVEELKQNNASCKRKLSTVDSSYKRMVMKNQLKLEKFDENDENRDSLNNGLNHAKLSKQNFMQDKDIVYLEKQLYDLQTSTVGIIGGMKCDFNQLTQRFIDPTDGHVDEQFKTLSSRMDKAYKAVADSNVEKVKEVLPAHYKYIEDDKFKVKKIRRLSQPAVLPSQRVLNNILDDKKPVLSPIPHTLGGSRVTSMNGVPVSTNGHSGTTCTTSKNPVIVDSVTNKLHPINPLKYFPFMSQAFILDQYKKFHEYDKNGDGTLDLEEMLEVVKKLGFKFNAHQLQDAMEEVDKDDNHTLDFYEYMLIIDNIYRRNGKAELFQQGFAELRKKNMSKACVIQ